MYKFMCVCVCVYIYICMYIYLYICVCVSQNICSRWVFVFGWTPTHGCICTVCLYTSTQCEHKIQFEGPA